jgi:hypothetical protein
LDLGAKSATFMADYFYIQQDITDDVHENSTCHPNCKYANEKDWQTSFCAACHLLTACEFDAVLLPMFNLITTLTPIMHSPCYCLTSDVCLNKQGTLPHASISAATAAPFTSRAAITTSLPASARRKAVACPIPCAPPVTMAHVVQPGQQIVNQAYLFSSGGIMATIMFSGKTSRLFQNIYPQIVIRLSLASP